MHKYPYLDDDGKLYRRYMNKKVNATKEGLEFNLTFDQFANLLIEANVKSSELGNTGYHLARHNDTGGYEVGNCAFVPYRDNLLAKKISEKFIEAARENVHKALEAINSNPEALQRRQESLERYRTQLKQEKEERRAKFLEIAAPSWVGEKNSQYGSYWITDGKVNKKWKDELGEIPEGFRRGRS